VLIESGKVPIMKSRPKRSILILSAVLVSFIFSVIGVLLLENYREAA
jgi:tyrosine-protein kinase Etk/Wzc